MKKFQILKQILKRTHSDQLLISFLLFILLDAFILLLTEPSFQTYGDSLWYCYAVITTIGFGDLVVTTLLGKILSIILSIYSILVIGVVTGIIVNFYTAIMKLQEDDDLPHFMDQLEHLPELSQEELTELSKNITQLRSKHLIK